MTNILRKFKLNAALLAGLLFVVSCGKRSDNQECEDSPKTKAASESSAVSDSKNEGAKTASKSQSKQRLKDLPWCRSCVVGPAGYMSCQTVRPSSANASETTDALRERARRTACKDAGFAEDKCPASNVVSLLCKGDSPPADKTAAARTMLNALKGSGPLRLTKDGKTVPNIMDQSASGAETSGQKPSAGIETSEQKPSAASAPPAAQ